MIRLALNATLFLYVFGVLIFSKVEGLSLATNLALLCLLVVLAIKGLRNGLAGLKYSLLTLPLAFILLLSIFWSRYPVEALIFFLSFLIASVGGMAVMLALMNGANPKSVFWATLLGSSYLGYSAWQEKSILMLSRVAGLAGNANDLAITLIICGVLLGTNRLVHSFWTKVYAFSLLIFSIYVTGSRKTLLALAVIVIFIGIYICKHRVNKISLKKYIFFIVLMFSSFPFLRENIWASFAQTATYERTVIGYKGLGGSENTRYQMILDGLALWKEKPLWGYGINQFRFETVHDTYSHNNYIELLVSGGILALFAYYGVLIALFMKSRGVIGQSRFILLLSLLLLFIWDTAQVSYSEKSTWLLIGICIWLSLDKALNTNNIHATKRQYTLF